MSLATPNKIRTLQRKLYVKAKAEPDFRFYLLYDKVWREDILAHAYAQAKANGGAAGVDGVTFSQIEAKGESEWLAGLREELRTKSYRPQPVRRVMIPKPGGGERPLGIPTIRDRVVQTAVKLVIEPIFEADLEASAYGYRPNRSATDAIREVHRLLRQGYTEVVDADLSRYFDTIPHASLMRCVARRIVDRHILWLIKMWLRAPVEERDGNGKPRLSGGKSSTRGTPQGGVISPLLANLYMNRLLKHWRISGQTGRLQGHIIAYADDFVVLSRGKAAEALAWIRDVTARLDLALNENKTSVRNARRERFDFLGYAFGPHWDRRTGQRYLGASPAKKSVQRIKDKIGTTVEFAKVEPWPEVRDRLNRLLLGWSAYFSYGTRAAAYRAIDDHVYDRVRHFLARRHKSASRGTRAFSAHVVFGGLGVLRLHGRYRAAPACARA